MLYDSNGDWRTSTPGQQHGPTEAVNGRLERLMSSAPGFRDLTHCIAWSLLDAGGFRPVFTLN